MSKPARDSVKARRICFDAHRQADAMGTYLSCHICKCRIDPVRQRNFWRADHIRRKSEDGEDTAENLWPICLDCDGGVGGKAARDTTDVAKGKAVKDKHYGITKPKSRPMPFGRGSRLKKKMNGEIVER